MVTVTIFNLNLELLFYTGVHDDYVLYHVSPMRELVYNSVLNNLILSNFIALYYRIGLYYRIISIGLWRALSLGTCAR